MIALNINGTTRDVDVEPETPLLWVLRDNLRLTGTKFGCGMALCGACTVHLDGLPMRSCSRRCRPPPASRSTTIEAIGATATGKRCKRPGWPSRCRSAATASRARSWRPRRCSKKAEADRRRHRRRHDGNICRCGTYPRIRAAIHQAAGKKGA